MAQALSRWVTLSGLRALGAFVVRDVRELGSYRLAVVARLLDPVVTVVTIFFYSQLVPADGPMAAYGGDYFAFVAAGLVLMQLYIAMVSAPAQRLRQEMLQGTLEATFAECRGTTHIVIGGMLFPALAAVVHGALFLPLATLFGARLVFDLPVLLGVASGVVLALASMGLVVAALVLLFQRAAPVVLGLNALVILLSGPFYPVGILPEALQKAAQLLPTTAALEALRRALVGGTGSPWGSVLVLFGFAAVGLPLGVVSLRLAASRARRLGQLGSY